MAKKCSDCGGTKSTGHQRLCPTQLPKCELIYEGTIRASCACGNWQYVGILPETKKAIKQIYDYHVPLKEKK